MTCIMAALYRGSAVDCKTLYTLLGKFQKEGVIEQVSNDGRRKTYILTNNGRELLLEEYNRLKMLVKDGDNILKGN